MTDTVSAFLGPSWDPAAPLVNRSPHHLFDSRKPWDSSLFTPLHSSFSSFLCSSSATPASPLGLRSLNEHSILSRPSPQITPQCLKRRNVQVLWCVNLVFFCQCGCHSTLHLGSRQEGLSSTSCVSCTCSWVCPSLQIASWHQ